MAHAHGWLSHGLRYFFRSFYGILRAHEGAEYMRDAG